jgi:hypothetical protein
VEGGAGKRLRSLHQFLRGDEPDDPEVVRLYTLGTLAERWKVLPSAVRDDLETDPERLAAECVPAVAYAEAYRAFKRGGNLDAWKGNKVMDAVVFNEFQLHKERKTAQEGERAEILARAAARQAAAKDAAEAAQVAQAVNTDAERAS